MFWEFVEAAFDSAGAGNHPSYDADTVTKIAEEVGIPDLAKFKTDYESRELKQSMLKPSTASTTWGSPARHSSL